MQTPSQPYKICPQCQTPAHLQAGECTQCGRLYHTRFDPSEQTQAFVPPPPYAPFAPQQPLHPVQPPPPYAPYAAYVPQAVAPKPNYVVIGLLWSCSALAGLLLKTDRTVALGSDVIAICCAVVLLMSPNRTNKTHGKVKLTFEAIAFVIGLALSLSGATHPAQPSYDNTGLDAPMRYGAP